MEVLNYDPKSGLFTRKFTKGGRLGGSVSGNKNTTLGYTLVGVDGCVYRAHRLAFLYMTGRIPDIIDHIDNNGFNNSWDNLREADYFTNGYNHSMHKNNTSGVKGVNFNKASGKWVARIRVNGVRKCLGNFSKLSDAEAAIVSARNKYHGEFANHGL